MNSSGVMLRYTLGVVLLVVLALDLATAETRKVLGAFGFYLTETGNSLSATSTQQTWNFVHSPDGTVRLRNAASNNYLGVHASTYAVYTTTNAGDWERFVAVASTNGGTFVQHVTTSRYLGTTWDGQVYAGTNAAAYETWSVPLVYTAPATVANYCAPSMTVPTTVSAPTTGAGTSSTGSIPIGPPYAISFWHAGPGSTDPVVFYTGVPGTISEVDWVGMRHNRGVASYIGSTQCEWIGSYDSTGRWNMFTTVVYMSGGSMQIKLYLNGALLTPNSGTCNNIAIPALPSDPVRLFLGRVQFSSAAFGNFKYWSKYALGGTPLTDTDVQNEFNGVSRDFGLPLPYYWFAFSSAFSVTAFGSTIDTSIGVNSTSLVYQNPNGGASYNSLSAYTYRACPCTGMFCANGNSCVDRLSYTDLCTRCNAPCQFGSCSGANGTCVCTAGYSGTVCQTNINECASAPCRNSGTCVDAVNGYSCGCLPGYSGLLCQTNINECASNPCTNGGTCADLVNGYSCACVAGYFGAQCQTRASPCSSFPCQNGASCSESGVTFTCTCAAGYSGVLCQTNINECASSPCENGATCVDGINGFACTCVPGYSGTTCHVNINECASNPCRNAATCQDQVNGYICQCQPGFSGARCQTDVNECASLPCRNNATCTDLVNGFNCSCLAGFSGNFCQTDINECASSPCANSATCLDLVNGFSCQCTPGTTGALCTWTDLCTSSPCRNSATCLQSSASSHTCICPAGYTGVFCEDLLQNCTVPRTDYDFPLSIGAVIEMSRICKLSFGGLYVFDVITQRCVLARFDVIQTGTLNQQWCTPSPSTVVDIFQVFTGQLESSSIAESHLSSDYRFLLSSGGLPCVESRLSADAVRYFQLLCQRNGQAYFSGTPYYFNPVTGMCKVDEPRSFCGDQAVACTKRCTSSNSTSCYRAGVCSCQNGNSTLTQSTRCGYKVDADLCPVSSSVPPVSTGAQSTSLCGIFTERAFFDCPAPYRQDNCTEICVCRPGYQTTPGSSFLCSGLEKPCQPGESLAFCGSTTSYCSKICEYTNPLSPPTYCVFVQGSCGEPVLNPAVACHPTSSFLTGYPVVTYGNASLSGDSAVFNSEPLCMCPSNSTGVRCYDSPCPSSNGLTCGGHGSCNSGVCSCASSFGRSLYSGCSCAFPTSGACTLLGTSCQNATQQLFECDECSGQGACTLSYNASALTLGCACGAEFTDSVCQASVCNYPTGCGRGTCVIGSSQPPYCDCNPNPLLSRTCSGSDYFGAGAGCLTNVCSQCAYPRPSGTDYLLCSGKGNCLLQLSGDYACNCTDGYTGSKCQSAPCAGTQPPNSYCNTAPATPIWTCLPGYYPSGVCSSNACGSLATPVATAALPSASYYCQCNNATMDNSTCSTTNTVQPATCCSQLQCPRDTQGVVCGFGYRQSQVPRCSSGGLCSCPYNFRASSAGYCVPFCNYTYIAASIKTQLCNIGLRNDGFGNSVQYCTGCTCLDGYNPATACDTSFCLNGGTPVQVSRTVISSGYYCNCAVGYRGTTCADVVCSGKGTLTADGQCSCVYPYYGVECEKNYCVHGVPSLTRPGQCDCVSAAWNGTLCTQDNCSPNGYARNDTLGCQCDEYHTGPLCLQDTCVHGVFNVTRGACDCNEQYSGKLCAFPRCGLSGRWNSTESRCECTSPAVALDTTGNCTASRCGAYGRLTVDQTNCTCVQGAKLLPLTFRNHSWLCEPVCLNGGNYSDATGGCECPEATAMPFCESFSQSSSTGLSTGPSLPPPGPTSSSSSSTATNGVSSSSTAGQVTEPLPIPAMGTTQVTDSVDTTVHRTMTALAAVAVWVSVVAVTTQMQIGRLLLQAFDL